jgi:hypothetical protein
MAMTWKSPEVRRNNKILSSRDAAPDGLPAEASRCASCARRAQGGRVHDRPRAAGLFAGARSCGTPSAASSSAAEPTTTWRTARAERRSSMVAVRAAGCGARHRSRQPRT